jgi:hypothetical protein
LLDLGRGIVVPAARGQALAVGLLQLAELGRLRAVFVDREAIADQEYVNRLAQLEGDVIFELRVASAWGVGMPLRRLGAVAMTDDADHGVTLFD